MKRHLILAFALLASSVALNAVNSLPDDDKSDNKNKTEINSVVKRHGSSTPPSNNLLPMHWLMRVTTNSGKKPVISITNS